MATMNDNVKSMIATLGYINENRIEFPDKETNILQKAVLLVNLASIGILDKMDVFSTIKDDWTHIDNALCEAMGYELLTKHGLSDRLDDVGQFITHNFPEDDVAVIRKTVEDCEPGILVPNTPSHDIDFDQILWDIIMPWFLDYMVGTTVDR